MSVLSAPSSSFVNSQLDQIQTKSNMEEAKQYYIIGDNLRHKGFYDDAISSFERALFIQEPLVGPVNMVSGKTHYALGLSKKAVKNYKDALSHLGKALRAFEEDKGSKQKGKKKKKQPHPNRELIDACKLNIARTHHSQGVDFQRAGNYDKSVTEHQKAQAIRESLLGKNHLETARTYYVLGCALSDRGDYDQALAELRRALKVRLTVMGKLHADSIEVCENIAVVLTARAAASGGNTGISTDSDKIHEYAKGGLLSKSIDKECEGEKHAAENAHTDALACFREALEVEEQFLGHSHPTTCDLHLKIAESLGENGELEESLREYKEALSIYERILGKFHVKLATIYAKLAGVLMTRGEYETSLSFYCKAYGIFDATLGNHPDTTLALKKVRLAAEKERNAMSSMEMLKTGGDAPKKAPVKKKKKNKDDPAKDDASTSSFDKQMEILNNEVLGS